MGILGARALCGRGDNGGVIRLGFFTLGDGEGGLDSGVGSQIGRGTIVGITLREDVGIFAVLLKIVVRSFSACRLWLPMCGNGAAGLFFFKTLFRLVAALVADFVKDMNGIFVCCGKKLTLLRRHSPGVLFT